MQTRGWNEGKGITIRLQDALYVPGMHTNIVSTKIMKKAGFLWDTRDDTVYRRTSGEVIAQLWEVEDQYAISSITAPTVMAVNRPLDNPQKGDAELWHRRLGHPGPDAMEKLTKEAFGVAMRGPSTFECDICAVSKIRRMVDP